MTNPVCVTIHAGHLSLDNGAFAPLTQLVGLAALLNVPVQYGQFYGDDRLEVPEEDWPVAKALLEEAKMLYSLPGDTPGHWRNVQSDYVRNRLKAAA